MTTKKILPIFNPLKRFLATIGGSGSGSGSGSESGETGESEGGASYTVRISEVSVDSSFSTLLPSSVEVNQQLNQDLVAKSLSILDVSSNTDWFHWFMINY